MSGKESLLDLAARLADELLVSADKSDIGYSWASPGLKNQHNLTGFSHGTAGVAFSLLELFAVTGNGRYRDAAERALDQRPATTPRVTRTSSLLLTLG